MHKIILASQSPRRKQLMELAELEFEVVIADVDETNPPGMPGDKVPGFLAMRKASEIKNKAEDAIIIAADTIVLLDHHILGKPKDAFHAKEMLQQLSGRMHQVVTGVCMQKSEKQICFSAITEVYFRKLTDEQIDHYIKSYQPFDKAGAYAIQEWIGMIGIEKINGDYYNVMGLPIGEVVRVLNTEFIN
ncbi:MAG TPA: Maf family protein [Flavipsychrobacter sp.]|nr:Maf family protein [Flavipsychrobacter sp.]